MLGGRQGIEKQSAKNAATVIGATSSELFLVMLDISKDSIMKQLFKQTARILTASREPVLPPVATSIIMLRPS